MILRRWVRSWCMDSFALLLIVVVVCCRLSLLSPLSSFRSALCFCGLVTGLTQEPAHLPVASLAPRSLPAHILPPCYLLTLPSTSIML